MGSRERGYGQLQFRQGGVGFQVRGFRTGEARSVENNRAFINPRALGEVTRTRRPATSGERRLTRTKHIRSRVLLASAA